MMPAHSPMSFIDSRTTWGHIPVLEIPCDHLDPFALAFLCNLSRHALQQSRHAPRYLLARCHQRISHGITSVSLFWRMMITFDMLVRGMRCCKQSSLCWPLLGSPLLASLSLPLACLSESPSRICLHYTALFLTSATGRAFAWSINTQHISRKEQKWDTNRTE